MLTSFTSLVMEFKISRVRSTFVLSLHIIFSPKSWELSRWFFLCDISETSLCVLFSQQWFSPWHCPMDAIFARCLSYCYNYFLAHLSLDSFFLSINEIIMGFFPNTFCIYSGYLSLILPFVDMKKASVKNMKKLELENGARSLLMGCLFLLATFFLECSKRHQLELAEVKSGRHQLELPTLANLSIKAAKTLNINVNKWERVEFFSRVQKGKNSYSKQSNC